MTGDLGLLQGLGESGCRQMTDVSGPGQILTEVASEQICGERSLGEVRGERDCEQGLGATEPVQVNEHVGLGQGAEIGGL